MSQKRAPGCTAARPASFARRTSSYTSRCLAVGSFQKKVRVMSEQYSSWRHPTIEEHDVADFQLRVIGHMVRVCRVCAEAHDRVERVS